MAKFRVAVLSASLVVAACIGAVLLLEDEPVPTFCTAEGAMLDGKWLEKDEDCHWIGPDGEVVLDTEGEPVDYSTPSDELPEGWGVS